MRKIKKLTSVRLNFPNPLLDTNEEMKSQIELLIKNEDLIIFEIFLKYDNNGYRTNQNIYGFLNKGPGWNNKLHSVHSKPQIEWFNKIIGSKSECIFRFNPLNQWKYEKRNQEKEKIRPIPRTNRKPEYLDLPNQFYGEMLNDSEFLNDDLTYEFGFDINNLNYIENYNHLNLNKFLNFTPILISK